MRRKLLRVGRKKRSTKEQIWRGGRKLAGENLKTVGGGVSGRPRARARQHEVARRKRKLPSRTPGARVICARRGVTGRSLCGTERVR